MNRQLQYAKCVTIRDAQLIEKQMLEQQRQQEEAETFRRTEEEVCAPFSVRRENLAAHLSHDERARQHILRAGRKRASALFARQMFSAVQFSRRRLSRSR